MSTRTASIAVGGLMLLLLACEMDDGFTLDAIHEDIVQRYEGVDHIDGPALQALAGEDVILFDVREREEFAVSHLAGATRFGPDEDLSEVLENGGAVRGKTVVFYCSVGHRSSAKAGALEAALTARGATAVYNLKGGIFQWRNESRPLRRGEAETRFVHPYNRRWGRLIEDPSAIRYE